MLKSIKIKHTYQYPKDDIVDDFYNKTLLVAESYDRVSGYFSSKSLHQYAIGLGGLLHNDGKMRLIISKQVPEEDYIAITEGYERRKSYAYEFKNEISPINNLEDYDSLALLSYLIAIEKLDIQVGFCKTGIFHSKFGIIKDKERNRIMFMGSHNETGAGINGNYEMFNVTTSWLSSDFDQQKIDEAESEFNKLWTDSHEGVIIVKEFSEILKSELKLYNPGRAYVQEGDDLLMIDNTIILMKEDIIKLKEVNLERSIDTDSFDFVFSLNRFFENEEYPYFKNDLSHSDLSDFIDEFSVFCANEKINLVVDSSVYKWIKENDFLIEQRMKYGNIIKNKDQKIIERFNKFSASVTTKLERVLRPQQMWSAFYMTEMKKTANFSVPGAGKTSMIYGAFAYLNDPDINEIDRIIMIGPKSAFGAWRDEFRLNFGDKKQLCVLDIHDENINAEVEIVQNYINYNLILVNYESLPRFEYFLKNIIDIKTMLVFDEVHRIKAVDGIRAKSALEISIKPKYKYVLTGTPIPNGYIDIYNFLNILFDNDYRTFFEWSPQDLNNLSYYEVDEINKKLAPFYWRTNKNELNVPPPNVDKIINIYASQQEQDIINMLHKKYCNKGLVLYIRLMQMSANPALLLKSINKESVWELDLFEGFEFDLLDKITDDKLFTNDEIALIKKVDKTQKYFATIEEIKKILLQGRKVVVWCVFIDTIKSLVEDLKKMGISADSVYGAVDGSDRLRILNNFKDGDLQVLVTNPHTLGEAVSLHHTCHDAVYMEYTFNLTHMLQSRDRIHRLGLKPNQETNYYYIMLKGDNLDTIDYKIYLRLKEKSDVMLKAIENNYLEPMPSESIDDILELFH